MRMSDSEFEAHLAEKWPDGPKRLPEKWLDPDFSNPSQPVVGVSWYEANAFCLWLTAETDTEYRLPTSDEWSAAARGEPGRDYAWGDVFDPLRCNSIASHLKRPSPVGVFVDGNTPEGVADMTGNVFEWTSTVAAGEPGPQVVIRGGAWASATEQLTAGLAPSVTPDRRSTDCGFRLAAVPARR
jgi:formylglycine-generating enzyme required for sulfatase activity